MTYQILQMFWIDNMMILLFFCDFDNVNVTKVTINNELVKLTEWLACNQLSLNLNKTKFMVFIKLEIMLTTLLFQ